MTSEFTNCSCYMLPVFYISSLPQTHPIDLFQLSQLGETTI